jgi:hypothetical protein
VRFPLKLPVTVRYSGKKMSAESQTISSVGLQLRLDEFIPVGATIQFTICMPKADLHLAKDVLVDCTGRVVGCSPVDHGHDLAAIIDEYCFRR